MRIGLEKFAGAFPALLTAFDASGKVQTEPMRQLVRDLILQDVTGFYVNGSSGEAMMLSVEERMDVFEAVAAEAKGEATLIAHVGTISQNDAVKLAQHAADHGADAVSAVPPFYYKFSFEEICGYYRAIADVGLPVVVYNIPATSGVTMTTAQLVSLLKDERIIGVKHTSTDYFQLECIRAAMPDVVLYNGYDETYLAGQVMGANGGIGTTYNFMPAKFQAISRAVARGDIAAAKAQQQSANRVIEAMLPMGVLPATKVILEAQGYDFGTCRPPFRTLTEEEKAALLAVCEQESVL